MGLGASWLGQGRCQFCVWAPAADRVAVRLLTPDERLLPLARDQHGYHSGSFGGIRPDARYFYRLEGYLDRPDPASRSQPQGVHGPLP
jgi:maltooligosyltrehalose trehalohydrolase